VGLSGYQATNRRRLISTNEVTGSSGTLANLDFGCKFELRREDKMLVQGKGIREAGTLRKRAAAFLS
jgi:hypothetical protein